MWRLNIQGLVQHWAWAATSWLGSLLNSRPDQPPSFLSSWRPSPHSDQVNYCTVKPHCKCKDTIPKFETNVPRKGIAWPQYAFPLSCVCERFYIFLPSVCLFCCRKICGPILGTHKSLRDTWCGNWDSGHAIPFLGIHKWDFRCNAMYLVGIVII